MPPAKTYYEWEVGHPGNTDVVAVVGGGNLELSFSNSDPLEKRFLIKILDDSGYVANPTDKLDLFTYDTTSSITVTEIGGVVQGINADSFDTSALDGTWVIGALGLFHEVYGDGSGHVYLTGLYGGIPIPEPATMALLAFGGLGLLLRRRSKIRRGGRR